jgi:prepilin-type N-terminal cleavage/methylation domain-containing protein
MRCRSQNMALPKDGGFTLLELLVVVVLMTILGSAVMASFSGGLRVWERSDDYGRSEQAALFIMERIGRDIANAGGVGEGAFEGTSDRMIFLTQVDAYVGPSPGPLERVTYQTTQVEPGELARASAMWPRGHGEELVERLADGHMSLELAYASELDGEAPGAWMGLWRASTNLPHAVRVTLVDREGESIERVFMPGSVTDLPPDDKEGVL